MLLHKIHFCQKDWILRKAVRSPAVFYCHLSLSLFFVSFMLYIYICDSMVVERGKGVLLIDYTAE